MDVNAYLGKQYEYPPCWQLVSDVYATELDKTVNDYKTVNASIRAIASAFRIALYKSAHGFAQVQEPVDFCVVLMGKTEKLGLHHCGIYYDGKVLHANSDGNFYQDMASLSDQYQLMEFWAKP